METARLQPSLVESIPLYGKQFIDAKYIKDLSSCYRNILYMHSNPALRTSV